MKNLLSILLIAMTINLSSQEKLLLKYKGLYQDSQGEKYLLNPRPGFPHFVVMKTGETHMIRATETTNFEFSKARNNWESIGGTIKFSNNNDDALMHISSINDSLTNDLTKVKIHINQHRLVLGDSLVISGDLISPIDHSKNAIAVLFHGDGDNDRYDLYDLGMYLVDNGYSVFAFDKRNVGMSYGKKVTGDSYDKISRVYAEDGVKIIDKLKLKYPNKSIGSIGISQGGWIGSIISSKTINTDFYVNIAGNISVGWQQWKHYMISYLKRNSFSKNDVAEAEDYFQSFFDAGLELIDFETYQTKLLKYKEKEWFSRLKKRKYIEWKSKKKAKQGLELNMNEPIKDLMTVNCPSLGVFYQHDHSTPPNSPLLFVKGLSSSNAKDITIRIFPNTTHGGWVVDNPYYNSLEITRQESEAYYFIIGWLNSILKKS